MSDSIPQAADDPFGPQLPPGALYVGSTLQQRIDLIEHLLEFGRQIVILSGPHGSGKSTLLAAIAQAADQRWSCVIVHGGPALQARTLLAQIADALDVDLSADSEPRMAQTMLRLRLNVLERAGMQTVLLVDDADQLPPDAVAALVALARSEDQAAEARVLMTANQEHASLLANLQRDRPQHGLVHVVEIPPLTESQTGEFIAQRLAAVGHALDDVFGPADLQRIALAAAGNPARVVALARQHYANRPAGRRDAGPRRTVSRAGRRRGLPAWRLPRPGDRRLLLLLLLPLLLALGAWWGLREADAPSSPATVAVELPREPAPAAPAETPPAAPETDAPAESAPPPTAAAPPPPDPRLADNGERDLIEIVLPDEPVPPLPAAPPAPAPAPTVPPAAAPVAPSPAPTSTPAPAAAPRPSPTPAAPIPAPVPAPAQTPPPAPKPKPIAPPKPAPTPAPVTPAPARPAGYSADWLLKQPRGAYTLQLAGVRDRSSAVHFIQRHGLSGAATILTTRRDGRPWYVLVHGYYPTRQAALAAAARLPAAVKKEVAPWARTIGELADLSR